MKTTVFAALLCTASLGLVACGGDKPAPSETQQTAVQTEPAAAVRTSDDALAALRAPTDIQADFTLMQAAELYHAKNGAVATRQLSNKFWAGDGEERNRIASAVLAKVVNDETPAAWSALRTGIGYVNGLGLEQDGDAAIAVLSSDVLADNAAAKYFLNKAYILTGDREAADTALKQAADLGHRAAIKEIGASLR